MNLFRQDIATKSMNVATQHSAMATLHWPPPPTYWGIAEGEVHVICVSLNVSPERRGQLQATLAPEELERAARFAFENGRHCFVVARGLLREVLGRYLGLPPEHLAFRYNASGKPELAGAAAERDLRFNVAHCGADAVFALTLHADIGVDLERVRAIPDMLQMVSFALSDSEKREWNKLEATEWRRAFFDCWARKEAFLKGIGEGLQRSPNEIEVPLRHSQSDESLSVVDRGQSVGGWSLRSLSVGDYAVAVAVKGQPTRVSCWAWQPREELVPAM